MPINFHDKANATTYAARTADESWLDQMGKVLAGSLPDQVADIGCGGGIYSRGWKALGAKSVVGIDFSQQMIDDARAVPAKATLSMERTLVSPVAGVVRATTKNHGNDAEHPHHANR